MAMTWGRRCWQVLAGALLVTCGVAAALPARPISLPPQWATMGAPSVLASLGHTPRSEYKRNAPADKPFEGVAVPPKRCEALVDARSDVRPAISSQPIMRSATETRSASRALKVKRAPLRKLVVCIPPICWRCCLPYARARTCCDRVKRPSRFGIFPTSQARARPWSRLQAS